MLTGCYFYYYTRCYFPTGKNTDASRHTHICSQNASFAVVKSLLLGSPFPSSYPARQFPDNLIPPGWKLLGYKMGYLLYCKEFE